MANHVVRTIVTAIHDKILIPWLAIAVKDERSKTTFLNIIRPRAFYYSTRDKNGQEFDLATPEDFRRMQLGFLSIFFFPGFSFFFFPLLEHPYRRGSNRQNYVVAPTKRDISFLAFDGCSSVLCKDRTILFHVLEYTFLSSPSALFFSSLSLFFRDLSFSFGAINFTRVTYLPTPPCVTRPYIPIS